MSAYYLLKEMDVTKHHRYEARFSIIESVRKKGRRLKKVTSPLHTHICQHASQRVTSPLSLLVRLAACPTKYIVSKRYEVRTKVPEQLFRHEPTSVKSEA